MLHDHARRSGHTAILLAGTSASGERVTQALRDLQPLCDGIIIETTVAFNSQPGVPGLDGCMQPPMAERLGVADLTLLLGRADGHIGLRADTDHVARVGSYVDQLRGQAA